MIHWFHLSHCRHLLSPPRLRYAEVIIIIGSFLLKLNSTAILFLEVK